MAKNNKKLVQKIKHVKNKHPHVKIKQEEIVEQQPKHSSWPKLRAIALGVTTVVAGLTYVVTSNSAESELRGRYSRYVEIKDRTIDTEFGTKIDIFATIPEGQRSDYVQLIRNLEERVGAEEEGLISFIDEHKEGLFQLTESKREIHGYVNTIDRQYQLEIDKSQFDVFTDNMREILAGDYTHIDEAIYTAINSNIKNQFMAGNLNVLEMQLQVLYSCSQYYKLSDEEKERAAVLVFDPMQGKQVPKTGKELDTYFIEANKFLKNIYEILIRSSGSELDFSKLSDPKTLAKFHTHPLNDTEHQPSQSDLANSILFGPNILFSQCDGIFHVYEILNGSYREIYTCEIAKK